MPVKDNTTLSKWLHVVSHTSLGIALLLACNTMFRSPDMFAYQANREIFYSIGFVCTVIYFVVSYWAMRRRKTLTETQDGLKKSISAPSLGG
ncbi:hypothetical protein ACFSHR_02470 [Azotobacter chroococcum]